MSETGSQTQEYNNQYLGDHEKAELKVEAIINSLTITSAIDPELIKLLLLIEGTMSCSDDTHIIAILRKQFETVFIQDIKDSELSKIYKSN